MSNRYILVAVLAAAVKALATSAGAPTTVRVDTTALRTAEPPLRG